MRQIITINKKKEVTRKEDTKSEDGKFTYTKKGILTSQHAYPFECKYIDVQAGFTCGGGSITPEVQAYIDKVQLEVDNAPIL